MLRRRLRTRTEFTFERNLEEAVLRLGRGAVSSFKDEQRDEASGRRLVDTGGGIETDDTEKEEPQSDKSQDGTEELFSTNSARVLEHADDKQSQEQAQEDGGGTGENQDAFSDHGCSLKGSVHCA
jgi:hypothetical protein